MRPSKAFPTIFVLGALAACTSTPTRSVLSAGVGDEWLQPSPTLEQQLEDEAERLPWTHGLERIEQIRWFASVGEPAYDILLDLVNSEEEHVASAALAALGATGDRRLVRHLRRIPWSAERQESDLHLERARTLVRLGDWASIPDLIEGLRDPRVFTRALCAKALRESTHLDFGFDPRGTEKERGKAVSQWETWWNKRAQEGIIARDASAPRRKAGTTRSSQGRCSPEN